MILSRVIEHVKAQNWTAVALDFVIVVMGVFMGLQVQNWNAAREDRLREHLILERLQSDFVYLATEQQKRAEAVKESFARGKLLYRIGLEKAVAPEDEAKAVAASKDFNVLLAPLPASSTYAEITSSGQVGLIRNAALRRALADYDSQRKRFDAAYPVMTSFVLENGRIISKYAKYDPATIPEEVGGFPSVGSMDWAALKTDPEFAPALSGIPRVKSAEYSYVSDLASKASNVNKMLDAELTR